MLADCARPHAERCVAYEPATCNAHEPSQDPGVANPEIRGSGYSLIKVMDTLTGTTLSHTPPVWCSSIAAPRGTDPSPLCFGKHLLLTRRCFLPEHLFNIEKRYCTCTQVERACFTSVALHESTNTGSYPDFVKRQQSIERHLSCPLDNA